MAGNVRAGESDASPRRFKRPRVLVACQRCKLRRQKCDNDSPACSNCARANVACAYSDNAYPSSYVRMLEERVGTLEERLSCFDPTQASDHMDHHGRPVGSSSTRREVRSQAEPAPRAPPSDRLTLGLGVLSSCAAAEPHYFGFSSGLSLAHFVQAAIETGNSTSCLPEVSLPLLADRPFSNQIPTSRTPLASLPSPRAGRRFIKAYLSTIHQLYPFLDRVALWRMHHQHTQSERLPSTELQLDVVVLHLVYAIGSRCLQLLGSTKVAKYIPEGHFMAAMQHVPEAMKFTSIRAIEITLLLGLHSMRSPSGGSVWHLCGLALRQCLELGLHKQRAVAPHQLGMDQRRKRLFWSAFIFERKTALVLGRPFALSEKEIDAEIPLSVDDDEEDIKELEAARDAQSAGEGSPRTYSTLSLHRHHVLLYRIHTKIRFTLHHLKNAQRRSDLRDKIAKRFQELEEWQGNVLQEYSSVSEERQADFETRETSDGDRDNSSDSDPDTDRAGVVMKRSIETEKTELLLEYHKARRSLLQPLMTETQRQSHHTFGPTEYAACADASGQICQLYRRLHRLSAIPFTLRDLHAVFVAGFTLIYCICARPSLYNARHAGDIGACSTVLYVITEQWSSAKKYRDAFEVVVERMLERTRSSQESEDGHDNDEDRGVLKGTRRHRRPHDQNPQSENILSTAPEMFVPTMPLDLSTTSTLVSTAGRGRTVGQRNSSSQDSHHNTRPSYSDNDHAATQNTATTTAEASTPAVDRSEYADADLFSSNFGAMGFGLDLESDFDKIGGLLTNEGLDWFTEVVL